MKTFFTSDTHWGHTNVIKYSNRPFKSVEEMDETLINNWNSVVGHDDHVYHLGDVSFLRPEKTEVILSKLNGKIFHLFGNHDKGFKSDRFEWQKDRFELSVKDPDAYKGRQSFVLDHFPIHSWNRKFYGIPHLHGHCHGSLGKDYSIRRIDVGVDCWNYTPVSYEQIKEELKKYKARPDFDHHNNKLEK